MEVSKLKNKICSLRNDYINQFDPSDLVDKLYTSILEEVNSPDFIDSLTEAFKENPLLNIYQYTLNFNISIVPNEPEKFLDEINSKLNKEFNEVSSENEMKIMFGINYDKETKKVNRTLLLVSFV